MNEHTEKELQRGAEAEQLIANPIFKEAMDGVENDIDKALLNVATTDTDLCLDLIRQLQQLQLIKAKIINFIQTGKMARATVNESVSEEKEITR